MDDLNHCLVNIERIIIIRFYFITTTLYQANRQKKSFLFLYLLTPFSLIFLFIDLLAAFLGVELQLRQHLDLIGEHAFR